MIIGGAATAAWSIKSSIIEEPENIKMKPVVIEAR